MKTIFTSFLMVCSVALFAQFSEDFAPANWTVVHSACDNGYVDVSGAPASITVVGSEMDFECGGATIRYFIALEYCGTITFDWDYTTLDCDGPFFDRYGYMVNGSPTQLSDNNGATNQTGSASVDVAAGDVFAFYIFSIDNGCLEAYTTVSNFIGPDDVCYGDEGEVKVQICHKGKTICVAPSAVAAHMAHGDVLGTCDSADGCGAEEGMNVVNGTTILTENNEELQLQPRGVQTLPSVEQLMAAGNTAAPFKSIDVSPNPAQDIVNITVNRSMEGPVDISIFNIAGQVVKTTQVDVARGIPVQVNIADLINGSYTIRLESQKGVTKTEKLNVNSTKH